MLLHEIGASTSCSRWVYNIANLSHVYGIYFWAVCMCGSYVWSVRRMVNGHKHTHTHTDTLAYRIHVVHVRKTPQSIGGICVYDVRHDCMFMRVRGWSTYVAHSHVCGRRPAVRRWCERNTNDQKNYDTCACAGASTRAMVCTMKIKYSGSNASECFNPGKW